MSTFANSAVNRLYIHGAFQTFAEYGGGAFVFVFLLKSGMPAPLVLCTLAAVTCGRFVLRPFVLPLAGRIGLRRSLIIGILIEAVAYALLPFVFRIGSLAYGYIVLASIGSLIYWTSMHAYTATLGDAEHRGGQVSVREAIAAVVSVVAPLAASLTLIVFGARWAFLGVAVVELLAAAPLIGAPDVAVDTSLRNSWTTARTAFGLFFADGLTAGFSHYSWQLALFVSLGENFGAYGAAMAAAGLVGAAATLVLGRLIDRGHGARLAGVSGGLWSINIIARALSFGSPYAAASVHALGALAAPVYIPVMMARVYNLAKESASPLRFHIAGEAGWDIGVALSALVSAALLNAGVSFSVPLLSGLSGTGLLYIQLRSSYRSVDRVRVMRVSR